MQLGVRDASHVLGILNLVEGDLLRANVLYMANATICKYMPFDLELTEDLLLCREDMVYSLRRTRHLEVVNMRGQDG